MRTAPAMPANALKDRLLACPLPIRMWACAAHLALIAVLSLMPAWLFPPSPPGVSGIDKAHLEAWCRELGWEKVLNKASTTFRELPEASRQGLDEKKAIALMLAQPTMIKRPVLDLGERRILAFKPDVYAAAFAKR